jgi:hypothetical protein
MSMMLTFRAGKVAALALSAGLAAVCLSIGACSREQQDWRSAEAADTVESYGQFLQRHPESELVTAARTRVAQLTEDHEWSQAGSTDTAEGYRQFLAQHPNGKWAQEARIRLQNFSLNGLSAQGAPVVGAGSTGAGDLPGTGRAMPGDSATAAAGAAPRSSTSASPGELAQPATAISATTRLSTAYVSTPPAIATGAAPTGGYGVQLGAFGSETAANAAWQQLATHFGAQLSGLSPHVIAANTTSGTLYRLQAQVPDEARARALCDLLRKESQPCVPVLPH